MAAGDAAAAAGYTVQPGTIAANTIDTAMALIQDDIANKVGNKGAAIPVALGGTGSATAATARTALGIPAILGADVTTSGGIPTYSPALTIAGASPTQPYHYATKSYVDAVAGGGSFLPLAGGTVTGQIYLPNAFAATSGYTVGYINGDGRICRGASSARFKKDIDRKPVLKGFVDLVASYKMRQDTDGVTRFGPIVEDMVKAGGDPAALVINDDQGRPQTFDQISYLMACIAELRAEIQELRDAP